MILEVIQVLNFVSLSGILLYVLKILYFINELAQDPEQDELFPIMHLPVNHQRFLFLVKCCKVMFGFCVAQFISIGLLMTESCFWSAISAQLADHYRALEKDQRPLIAFHSGIIDGEGCFTHFILHFHIVNFFAALILAHLCTSYQRLWMPDLLMRLRIAIAGCLMFLVFEWTLVTIHIIDNCIPGRQQFLTTLVGSDYLPWWERFINYWHSILYIGDDLSINKEDL